MIIYFSTVHRGRDTRAGEILILYAKSCGRAGQGYERLYTKRTLRRRGLAFCSGMQADDETPRMRVHAFLFAHAAGRQADATGLGVDRKAWIDAAQRRGARSLCSLFAIYVQRPLLLPFRPPHLQLRFAQSTCRLLKLVHKDRSKKRE